MTQPLGDVPGGSSTDASGASSGGSESGGSSSGGSVSGGAANAGTAPGGESAGGSTAQGGTAAPTAGTNGDAGAETEPPLGGAGGSGPQDDCPTDPNKLAPGVCGCGIPDVATAELSDCASLKDALIHRYDFEGNGTTVTDRVGTAHGVTRSATLSKLDGKGVVLLGGGTTGGYVDLPNRLVSVLGDASFEAWLTWGGGRAYQRVFDFGDSTAGSPENNPTYGKSYLFASPRGGSGNALVAYSLNGTTPGEELNVNGAAPLEQTLSQVVVVANDTTNELLLYVNGALSGKQPWAGSLAAINDVNVWLGRSQYEADAELSAVYHDFRVYDSALSAAQVASSFRGGPDPEFLKK